MLLVNTDCISGKELEMLGADAIINIRYASSAIMQGGI